MLGIVWGSAAASRSFPPLFPPSHVRLGLIDATIDASAMAMIGTVSMVGGQGGQGDTLYMAARVTPRWHPAPGTPVPVDAGAGLRGQTALANYTRSGQLCAQVAHTAHVIYRGAKYRWAKSLQCANGNSICGMLCLVTAQP